MSRLELNSFNEIVMTVAGVGKVSVSDLILINELQRMEWRAFIGFQHVLVRCLSISIQPPKHIVERRTTISLANISCDWNGAEDLIVLSLLRCGQNLQIL